MNLEPLPGIKACVFDAYGTLLDFSTTVSRSGLVPEGKLPLLNLVWREKQLQYTWLRSLQGRYADFWQVTEDALDYAMQVNKMEGVGLRENLLNLYLRLEIFPEVPKMLRELKAAGLKTAILSNGSPDMLKKNVAYAEIEGLLDAVLSVDDLRVYKPDPKVYQLAVDHLQVHREEIAFMSSNSWDVWAASAFGMRAVWCNRQNNIAERLPGKPDREVNTLAGLSKLFRQ